MDDPIARPMRSPSGLLLLLLAPLACIGPPKLDVTYADYVARAGPVRADSARIYVYSLPYVSAGGAIEIDEERIGAVYGGGICSFVVATTRPGRHRVASIADRWGHESGTLTFPVEPGESLVLELYNKALPGQGFRPVALSIPADCGYRNDDPPPNETSR